MVDTNNNNNQISHTAKMECSNKTSSCYRFSPLWRPMKTEEISLNVYRYYKDIEKLSTTCETCACAFHVWASPQKESESNNKSSMLLSIGIHSWYTQTLLIELKWELKGLCCLRLSSIILKVDGNLFWELFGFVQKFIIRLENLCELILIWKALYESY